MFRLYIKKIACLLIKTSATYSPCERHGFWVSEVNSDLFHHRNVIQALCNPTEIYIKTKKNPYFFLLLLFDINKYAIRQSYQSCLQEP
jgi:hypothetical protein